MQIIHAIDMRSLLLLAWLQSYKINKTAVVASLKTLHSRCF